MDWSALLAMTGGVARLQSRHCEEALADAACRERSRTAIQGLGHRGRFGRRAPVQHPWIASLCAHCSYGSLSFVAMRDSQVEAWGPD